MALTAMLAASSHPTQDTRRERIPGWQGKHMRTNSKKYTTIKIILLLVFHGSALMIIGLDVRWFYRSFDSSLEHPLAQAGIAYHILLLSGLAGTGVWLGQRVDRMIREKKSIFHCVEKGSWAEIILNLWGYVLEEEDHTQESHADPLVLLDLPTRRGRKPVFTLDRWLPIAAQWENRDPIRDGFTLADLIADHLGTNADGSPIVSEQTYYNTWRPRAIAELRRRAQSKKPAAKT
jgi:hypothetical protein